MKNICHLADCMEFMRDLPDNHYDLAIVDPPYGIGEDGRKTESRVVLPNGTLRPKIDKRTGRTDYVKKTAYLKKNWDNASPPVETFAEIMRVTQNQIIWGANHFISKIPFDSSCWIVWDKMNGTCDFADCELAWSSFSSAVRKVSFMWSGMMQGKSLSQGHIQQGNKKLNEKRIHPTQKPVALYKWLLKNYAKPGDTIFDSHVGSGSIRIACHDLDFEFTGCEIDADYHSAQEARFVKHTDQLRLL